MGGGNNELWRLEYNKMLNLPNSINTFIRYASKVCLRQRPMICFAGEMQIRAFEIDMSVIKESPKQQTKVPPLLPINHTKSTFCTILVSSLPIQKYILLYHFMWFHFYFDDNLKCLAMWEAACQESNKYCRILFKILVTDHSNGSCLGLSITF